MRMVQNEVGYSALHVDRIIARMSAYYFLGQKFISLTQTWALAVHLKTQFVRSDVVFLTPKRAIKTQTCI